MAELNLTIDEEDEEIFLEGLRDSGLSPAQFFKSLLQNFSNSEDEWEVAQETRQSLLQGTADFEAGKLKTYSSWKELIKDKKTGYKK